MKGIISEGLEPKREKKRTSKRLFKISLALVLIIFAFTMSSSSSFFQIVKPAEAAGTLNGIAILPTNNIVNTRGTYDILFNTATTGTIKTITMSFPSGFDVSAATRWIERSGIGSGSLSSSCSISGCDLKYTVSSPVSVPAGTTIRLEIPRIVNPNTAGSFKVAISTEAQVILDGPTQSPSFPIKDITGNDISPTFMIRKTLHDDAAGNAKGWTPSGAQFAFEILDSDIDKSSTGVDSTFVSIVVQDNTDPICTVTHIGLSSIPNPGFRIFCDKAPANNAQLHYEIHKLPPHLIISSASASASASLSQYESARAHDQIASEFP